MSLRRVKYNGVIKVQGKTADFVKRRGFLRATLTWRGKVVGPKRQFLKPLKVEDGRNGYWLAGGMGNGVGDSFIDLNGKAYYFR